MPAHIVRGAITAALLALPSALGAQQTPGRAPLDTAALERVLLGEMRETHTPGVSIAVVRGSEVVYAKGFGVTSVETREPVTPETLFRIGSTTKMFTGLTAVLLAQDGKLRFDTPINRYAKGLTPPIGR
ncbi:MAG TPA: serine hydrolase domain-containing protein, partial [Gemmatimonadaceae bacterium]|nr:serine hydrolase domain-containing protein [Gemmatimonadaceae bacterium]